MKWQTSFSRLSPCLALILASVFSLTVPAGNHPPDSHEVREGPQKPAQSSAGLPASLAGFSDEGVFLYFENGEQGATIDFKWESDGRFYNRVTYPSHQEWNTTITVTPDKDGRWVRVEWKRSQGVYSLDVREGTVVKSMDGGGKLLAQRNVQTDELLYILTAPALFGQAIRLYDRTRGGKQSFHEGGTAFLEIERGVERTVGASNLKLSRFIYTNAGGFAAVIVDWSSGAAVFVRRGYETLR